MMRPAATPGVPAVTDWRMVRLGLCEDYPEESRSPARAESDLALARAAGAKVLRISFGWDAMEPERGVYDWSFWDEFVRRATEEHGLQLIPYVCYTPKWAASDPGEDSWRSPPRDPADFARFMSAIVTRYRGSIRTWELWNEPDNRHYWLGTPQQFAALVRAGSAAVRAADPGATVVLGGIAGEVDFLTTLFRDERIAPHVDVVNVHNYFETWHPHPIEELPGYLWQAADVVRTHGENEPLWLAEVGYSSVGPRPVISEGVYRARLRGEHTDAAQAAALARMVLLALATPPVSLVAWYRINDLPPAQEVIGDDNNRHLGVQRGDGTPKPARAAFAQLTRLFGEARFRLVAPPVRVRARRQTEPVVQAFALQDGRHVLAAWMASARGNPPQPEPDERAATLEIRLPGVGVRSLRAMDAAGRPLPPGRVGWQSGFRGTEVQLELRGGQVVLCELVP